MKISIEKCIAVEDAVVGLDAAIASNMDNCAIGDAVFCEKATYNLNSFRDLLILIK